MTILAELAALYDRMPDLPRPGYSREAIGGEIVLRQDGTVVEINVLAAPDEKGKLRPRSISVPAAIKRASGIQPNLFWDKSAYVLGVIAAMGDDGKPLLDDLGHGVAGQGKRTATEHAAFVSVHTDLLVDVAMPSLIAFRTFLERWSWQDFAEYGYSPKLLDQNLVFRIQGDTQFLHDLPEVAALLAVQAEGGEICLVSGEIAPVARLHPSIKGVMGAQSSGASLVSFNDLAYESHGKKQGDNAPVSAQVAFAYGTALNALLARGSGQTLRVGDATVVFWVEAATPDQAVATSWLFAEALSPSPPEDADTAQNKVSAELVAIARGRWQDAPDYDPETRVFVLGLAPNAARLSVRFWHPGRLQDFAERIATFWDDLAIEPSPWLGLDGVSRPPAAWRLLYDIAALGDAKNIPPLLGGALMRSILTGANYPRMLLSSVIGRLRVEGTPTDRFSDGRRAAIIRAVLTRNTTQEVPMALDETSEDPAYVLGRLFGAFTYAERSYADRGATIRDKYMGGASATPARIFPMLMKGYEHNRAGLAKAGGQKVGAGIKADKAIAAILAKLPGDGVLPSALPLEDQGRFFIGFYHQLSAFYQKAEDSIFDDTLDGEIE
ncbi:type I-C CRISPR-associated protein Cas8c/Csd1 [Pontivivens nitratireducens]|uniref:Type I-C CRISPR-associated protein Cas8c/Csd1 n=1 Tax=Pontivivens nitratireducens TaxID=2758038 RepID=A0A6G7VNM6_9RHOB|nr:type I-C CRISPR-associated protein Cas8c/Csd1 [Pontibrevibacter nitratireducens]QIK41522.1 type I-C CRISPR-associated protein Cas8c/Csd1 [Pontibrevibacter nitratireducens]